MASFARVTRSLFSEEIVLIPDLPLHSLYAQVPGLINGAELRRRVEIYPTFDKIVGLKNPKAELRYKISSPNKELDTSYIIVGAHGTGKTALAKAAIRAYVEKQGAIMFHVTKSSMAAPTDAERLSKVRYLFELAERNQPSVILIQCLEEFLHKNMEPNDSNAEIQRQIARIKHMNGVLILGITSHPELLHEVTFKRFRRVIYCAPPTDTERKDLLKVLLEETRPWTNVSEYQLRQLGVDTKHFSRADMVDLVTDVLKQVPESRQSIDFRTDGRLLTIAHFYEALKVRRGRLDRTGDKRITDFLTEVGGKIIS